MAVQGLAEIVLLVHDLEKSLAFYRDTLGMKVISPTTMQGVVFLQVGESDGGVPQQVVLASLPPDSPPFADRLQRGVHHIGIEISSDTFAQEQERLEGLGLNVRTGEHPFLPVQAIYFDDPDGNEIELVAAKV